MLSPLPFPLLSSVFTSYTGGRTRFVGHLKQFRQFRQKHCLPLPFFAVWIIVEMFGDPPSFKGLAERRIEEAFHMVGSSLSENNQFVVSPQGVKPFIHQSVHHKPLDRQQTTSEAGGTELASTAPDPHGLSSSWTQRIPTSTLWICGIFKNSLSIGSKYYVYTYRYNHHSLF